MGREKINEDKLFPSNCYYLYLLFCSVTFYWRLFTWNKKLILFLQCLFYFIHIWRSSLVEGEKTQKKKRIMVVYETTKRSKTDIFNLLQATQNSFELRQKQYFHFYSLFIEVYRLLSTLHKQYDSIKNF